MCGITKKHMVFAQLTDFVTHWSDFQVIYHQKQVLQNVNFRQFSSESGPRSERALVRSIEKVRGHSDVPIFFLAVFYDNL